MVPKVRKVTVLVQLYITTDGLRQIQSQGELATPMLLQYEPERR